MRILTFLVLGSVVFGAEPNTLTPEEKKAGFRLLFDGKTFRNWRDPAQETPPGDSWIIQDGTLQSRVKPHISEDLLSKESFGDFELKFDWKVAPASNTGVKYRIQRLVFMDLSKEQKGPGGFEGTLAREIQQPLSDRKTLAPSAHGYEYVIGYEFQLIDKAHPDSKKDATHTTGALYSFIAPTATAMKEAGEWNESRLVVKGSHFEHWINGVKVLDGSLSNPAIAAGANKRWAIAPEVRDALVHPKPAGPISLQHHGDLVWFRNIKIRTLE